MALGVHEGTLARSDAMLPKTLLHVSPAVTGVLQPQKSATALAQQNCPPHDETGVVPAGAVVGSPTKLGWHSQRLTWSKLSKCTHASGQQLHDPPLPGPAVGHPAAAQHMPPGNKLLPQLDSPPSGRGLSIALQ